MNQVKPLHTAQCSRIRRFWEDIKIKNHRDWVSIVSIFLLIFSAAPACSQFLLPGRTLSEASPDDTPCSRSVKECVADIHSAQDKKERAPQIRALYRYHPKTAEDVRELADIAKGPDDNDELVSAARYSINNISASDQQLETAFSELVNDKHSVVRYLAMKNCGVLKSKHALPLLVAQLTTSREYNHPEDFLSLFGAEAGLALYGNDVLPELIRLYKDSKIPEIKTVVLETILQIKDPNAVDSLLAIAGDKTNERDLRETAIDTLWSMRATRAATGLILIYNAETDASIKTRLVSAMNIMVMESPETTAFLEKVLLGSENAEERDMAAYSLRWVGREESVAILKTALKTEKNPVVRRDIASCLAELPYAVSGEESYDE